MRVHANKLLTAVQGLTLITLPVCASQAVEDRVGHEAAQCLLNGQVVKDLESDVTRGTGV